MGKVKRRQRNHISNKQRYESIRDFAHLVTTGGMKRDLERIKVIPQVDPQKN